MFVHGALCMCYSGQCTMSALIGQRSGNRGACAQPCRLPYGVNGPCKNQFPLSLKDANLSAYLQELGDMGVACLKLEGRMKRPEYVAVITSIYRRLIDEKRGPTAAESQALEQAFSRSGFTDGYYRHRKGSSPCSAPVRRMHRSRRSLFNETRKLYENGEHKRIPITMQASIFPDKPAALTVSDGAHAVTVTGPVPEVARNRALTAEDTAERLQKTGGTVFRCETAEVSIGDGLMLSASAINGLRRDALDALAAARTAVPERRSLPTPALPERETFSPAAPKLTCSIARLDQLTDAVAETVELVYVPIELLPRLTDYRGRAKLARCCPVCGGRRRGSF